MTPSPQSSTRPTAVAAVRRTDPPILDKFNEVMQRHPEAFMAVAVMGGLILGWVLKRR